MLQAAIGDGLAFDPFAFEENGLAAPDVDVGRGEIAKALMVAAMIVVLDEGRDLALEGAGQGVVLEQDAVLWRLMPAFDLALCLRMVGRTADVLHAFAVQPCSEIDGDVGRTIVRQQSRPVNDGTVTWSRPAAARARSRVAVTSSARMVAPSFQATMKREKSSSRVER